MTCLQSDLALFKKKEGALEATLEATKVGAASKAQLTAFIDENL